MLRFGFNGAKKDQREAAKLLELAADSGDLLAMIQMGYVWVDGFPDDGVPPCKEKTMEFYLRAARQGHFLGQYQVGHALDPDDEDEPMWYMLSAAQGYTLAQCALGKEYHRQYVHDRDVHGTNDPTTLFKALYWLKQAAIQGYTKAQILLAGVLLDSRDVFYSPIPEATFWFNLAVSKDASHEEKRPDDLKLLRCGSCKKSEHGSAKLKCCTKCQGVRYCDRDCQAKHWKMGHKRDCAAVAACREALRVSSTADIQQQYPVSKTPPVESGAGGE
jgi:TPR repeat protein